MDSLSSVLTDLASTKLFAFDLEAVSTTGRAEDAKNPRTATPTIISIATRSYFTAVVAAPKTLTILSDLLKDPSNTALVHNMSYDMALLHHTGNLAFHDCRAQLIDTVVQAWLWDESTDHGLKELVQLYFGHKMTTYKEVSNTSPTMTELNMVIARELELAEIEEQWPKKIPYPEANSAPFSKLAIRRMCTAGLPTPESKEQEKLNKLSVKAVVDRVTSDEAKAAFIRYKAAELPRLAMLKQALTLRANKEMLVYAADDAKWTMRIYQKLLPKLKKAELINWWNVENVVRRMTVDMELLGAPIDIEALTALQKRILPLIEEFRAEVYNLAKREVNINSPDQLRKLLFEDLHLMPPANLVEKFNGPIRPKLTPAGEALLRTGQITADLRYPDQMSPEVRTKYLATDTAILERIAHPIGQAILNYRTVEKLNATYVSGFLETLAARNTSRLCARFNSVGTETGRFSSSQPNFQNIPSRSKGDTYDRRIQKLGKEIRRSLRAETGWSLIVADQSQIELRLLAHFSQDRRLLQVYREFVSCNGYKFFIGDVHKITSELLRCSRSEAKPVNFGFNYGMGAEKFARQQKLIDKATGEYDIPKAELFREGFFRSYPGVPNFMAAMGAAWREGAREFSTLCGRHRHFEREAQFRGNIAPGTLVNCKIQGSSADTLKAMMYIFDKYVQPKYPLARLLIQVHDELVFQCPTEQVNQVAALLKYVMEYAWFPVSVPLLASVKICERWSDKDDDDVPEYGMTYAQVNDSHRIFTAANWAELRDIEKTNKSSIKIRSSCASMTEEDTAFCKSLIPDRGFLMPAPMQTSTIISREDRLKAKLLQ